MKTTEKETPNETENAGQIIRNIRQRKNPRFRETIRKPRYTGEEHMDEEGKD